LTKENIKLKQGVFHERGYLFLYILNLCGIDNCLFETNCIGGAYRTCFEVVAVPITFFCCHIFPNGHITSGKKRCRVLSDKSVPELPRDKLDLHSRAYVFLYSCSIFVDPIYGMITQISKLRVQRRLFIVFLIVMLCAFYVRGAAGAVYYVDDNAALGGDGRSWETSYKYIQDALYDSALTNGDTIRVAAGTYTSDKDEGGNVTLTDRPATFQLVNGVELYGGYAGVPGANPNERAPDTYVSVLSGDLAGNDEPDFVNYSENSYHVVTGSGTDATAVLDGFTISGGNANGDGFNRHGGGIFNDNGSPTVTNCTFTENTSIAFGGGMYNFNYSSPTVTHCIFKDNHADDYGGGMENDFYCSPTVTDCTFSGNTSTNGGGIDNFIDCNSTVTDCTFNNNSATNGGGMSSWGSSPIVTKCTFRGNIATESGGGIYDNGSSPTVTNCIFSGNMATLSGGGMYNYNGSPTVLRSLPIVFFGGIRLRRVLRFITMMRLVFPR